jgi:Tryptophan halogenase
VTMDIVILGNGVEATLFAALFSHLQRGFATLTLVAPASNPTYGQTVALPSDIDRAHRILRIAPPTMAQIGAPRFGLSFTAPTGKPVIIPYGTLGPPDLMGEFADHWIRARVSGESRPVTDYSVNARLMAVVTPTPLHDPDLHKSVAMGWEVNAILYRQLLQQSAAGRHAMPGEPIQRIERGPEGINEIILADGSILRGDLYIDASEGRIEAGPGSTAGWSGNMLTVGTAAQRLDGPEPFTIAATVSAVARLTNLMPRADALPVLAAEYRRLLAQEQEGMLTAAQMLRRLSGDAVSSDKLDAHEARYRDAGLLPVDPQPWSPDMWLACLDARGIRPRRYDPNVDRHDAAAFSRHAERWRARIDAIQAPVGMT